MIEPINLEPIRVAIMHEGPEQTADLLDQAFIRLTLSEVQEGNCIDSEAARILWVLYVLRDALKKVK